MTSIEERFRALDSVQFDSGKAPVLFVPDTLQIFTLSAAAGSALASVRSGASAAQAALAIGIGAEEFQTFLERVVAVIGQAPPVARQRESCDPRDVVGVALPKLVFMVNNHCNLACTYCYEHETIFKQPPGEMPFATIDAALDRFYGAFARFGELMFIGGEPTLAPDAIGYACKRATAISQARGTKPPRFSMITNGVKMNDRIFELIEEFHIQVTFSIDGPKEVHDLVRINHNNAGSYNQVAANILRYSEHHQDQLGLECTLSAAQARNGVTVSDLTRFFAQEFGMSEPHIAVAGLTAGDLLNPFSNQPTRLQREFERAAEVVMEEWLCDMESPGKRNGARPGLDLVTDMVRKLVRQTSPLEMCPAGTSQLVVDSSGEVYPCWMFAAMPQYRMGNVHTDDVFNAIARGVLDRIIANNKRTNPQCRVCYARYVCHPCLGNNQNGTGSIEKIDEAYCRTIRGTLRSVVVKIAEAKQDPVRWGALRDSVSKSEELHSSEMPC
jgi:uncharacterized protein